MLRKVFAAALTSGALILGSSVSPAHASAPIAVANPIGRGSAAPVVPLNTQQYLVEFECAAAAVGAISSTRVDYCNLYANGGYVAGTGSLSLPGEAPPPPPPAPPPPCAPLLV